MNTSIDDDIQLDYLIGLFNKYKNYIFILFAGLIVTIAGFNIYFYNLSSKIKSHSLLFDNAIYSSDNFTATSNLNKLSKKDSIYGEFARFVLAGYSNKYKQEYDDLIKDSQYEEIKILSPFYSDYYSTSSDHLDLYDSELVLNSLIMENVSSKLLAAGKYKELVGLLENYNYNPLLVSDSRISDIHSLSKLYNEGSIISGTK